MRTFKHSNFQNTDCCPICGNAEDKEVVLIGVSGTEEGNNIQAIQVHSDCLISNLRYIKDVAILCAVIQ